MFINSFVPNAPFLYPLTTSENLKVFCCFQGVAKGCIGNKWVNLSPKQNLSKICPVDSVINHCVKSFSGVFLAQMRENADQNNSEYEHFSRRVSNSYFFQSGINAPL